MLGEPQFERVEHDLYPTPPENLDCLGTYLDLESLVVWEPACGLGHLSKRLVELGTEKVISTDLIDRGFGSGGIDFLKCPTAPGALLDYGNKRFAIITNPPYGELAEQFVRKALELTKPHNGVVAMFLRNEWDCAKERMDLFRELPFALKIIVTKRPRWIPGSKGSPRHTYAWYVWDWSRDTILGSQVAYIHPNEAQPLGQIRQAA
jgi:hypothetical protein